MVSSFISALGGIEMANKYSDWINDFDGFQFTGSPPPWTSTYKYRNQHNKHEDPAVDVDEAVKRVWGAFFEVTCLECEHFRQDSDDGTICPRCTKGQSIIISDGKKKKHCMHFDKLTT